MEIGIDASRLTPGRRTGTENYTYQLTRQLVKEEGSKYHFKLYFNQVPSPQTLLALNLPAGVETRIIPFPRLWTHFRLGRELAAAPPDTLFIPAHVLPLFHPAASVVTIHDLGYLYFPETHPLKSRLYLDLSTRFSAKKARQIIAVSQATRQDLIRHYHISPEKIKVIYHGYDHEFFQPVSGVAELEAIRSRYKIQPGPYLLFVGTIQPRKNLARLLEAFASLIQDPDFETGETGNLQLILAGQPGWLRESILKKVAGLQLENRVNLVGYIPDEDLPGLISGAAAFILPSLYEGFGMGVIEAMACGCPVICSNAGSLPEVAGQAALFHHPLDTAALAYQIKRLFKSPGLREELIRQGFIQARKFSWEKCAAETLDLLNRTGG